jgi:hypothetical protein
MRLRDAIEYVGYRYFGLHMLNNGTAPPHILEAFAAEKRDGTATRLPPFPLPPPDPGHDAGERLLEWMGEVGGQLADMQSRIAKLEAGATGDGL